MQPRHHCTPCRARCRCRAGGSTPASVGSTMPTPATSPISLLSQGVPFEMRPIAARNRHSPARALCSELPPAAWHIAAPAWDIARHGQWDCGAANWCSSGCPGFASSTPSITAGTGQRGRLPSMDTEAAHAPVLASAPAPTAAAVSLPGTWPTVTTIGRTWSPMAHSSIHLQHHRLAQVEQRRHGQLSPAAQCLGSRSRTATGSHHRSPLHGRHARRSPRACN